MTTTTDAPPANRRVRRTRATVSDAPVAKRFVSHRAAKRQVRLDELAARQAEQLAAMSVPVTVGDVTVMTGSTVRAGYAPNHYGSVFVETTPKRPVVTGVLRPSSRTERAMVGSDCVVVQTPTGQRELFAVKGLSATGAVFVVVSAA